MPLNSIPPTVDVPALGGQRKAAERQAWSTWGSGAGRTRNCPSLAGCTNAGGSGSSVSCCTPGGRVPHLAIEDLPAVLRRDPRLRFTVDRPRRGLGRDRPRAHRARGAVTATTWPRAPPARRTSPSPRSSRRPGGLGRGSNPALSSSDALPMIRTARRDGVRITVETCPHYLLFTAEEVQDGQTRSSAAPIREADNRELLWHGLHAGDVDSIVSDHSPCTPELKRFELGDFGVAWAIASLQVGCRRCGRKARLRGFTLCDVVRGWPSVRPRSPACTARPHRVGLSTRTSASSPRTMRSSWTRPGPPPPPRHALRRAARWPAWCALPGCTASGSATGRPRGRLMAPR